MASCPSLSLSKFPRQLSRSISDSMLVPLGYQAFCIMIHMQQYIGSLGAFFSQQSRGRDITTHPLDQTSAFDRPITVSERFLCRLSFDRVFFENFVVQVTSINSSGRVGCAPPLLQTQTLPPDDERPITLHQSRVASALSPFFLKSAPKPPGLEMLMRLPPRSCQL